MKLTKNRDGNSYARWLWFSLMVLLLCSCQHEPAISKTNVKLIGELKTAIGAKRTDWLEQAAKNLEQHRQRGQVSDEENAVLQSIVSAARKGDWSNASAQLTQLINAQHAP
jgi:hypothetical protein